LLEAGLEYESVDEGRDIFKNPELRKIHPLGKLPAALIDGKPLFESAAISSAIADMVPKKELIAKPGTWSRALHDQWVCFALSELEAWAWSNAVNTFVLPEDQRVPEIKPQNALLFKRGAAALDKVLGECDYLIENRFTVTDIIVSYAVNFGRLQGWTEEFSNIRTYLDRLFEREHCTLGKQAPPTS